MNQLQNKPETFVYIGRNIPELAKQGIPRKLDDINTSLALKRAKFTENDQSIRRLIEKRTVLMGVFQRQTYRFLYAQRAIAEARLRAAERPKGVLIKYRELLRTAARDEATLTKLESERQILALEQARKEDPWELISTPMLLDKPVAPRKKRITILGLFTGLVLGCGAALIKDRRTGLIYNKDQLISLLPCPLIKNLPTKSQDSWADSMELLATELLKKVSKESAIALIPLGKIPNDQLQAISAELSRAIKDCELVVSTDLVKSSKCVSQILITAPGVITRDQLSDFLEKLLLQGTPIEGWIYLDPKLDLE